MQEKNQWALQSTHNKEVSNHLFDHNSDYIDWAIIALFYSNLHLINAYFAKHGINVPTNHYGRKSLVQTRLHEIYDDYCILQDYSEMARYDKLYSSMSVNDLEMAQKHSSSIHSYLSGRI